MCIAFPSFATQIVTASSQKRAIPVVREMASGMVHYWTELCSQDSKSSAIIIASPHSHRYQPCCDLQVTRSYSPPKSVCSEAHVQHTWARYKQ